MQLLRTRAARLVFSAVLLGALFAVLLATCGGETQQAETTVQPNAEAPEETAEPAEEPAPDEEAPEELDAVRILTATVGDLLDRLDLTVTVTDLLDRPMGEVPDLVGLTEALAREAVEDAGFVPYFVDTFPPTGGPDQVLETFPRADELHQLGANVFIEVDGPTEGILAQNGERLLGLLNGQQLSVNPDATIWIITIWLDDPLAFDGFEEEVAVGREVRVFVDAGDVACESDGSEADVEVMTSGIRVAFVLDHQPDIDLFAPIGGRDLEIDCQPDL